jgi:hypothetical protein
MCVTWAILKSLYKLVPSRSSVVMLLWDLLVVEMRNPRKWLMDDQWKLLNLPSFALQLWQSRAWWCTDRSTESCVHCLSLYPWCASEYVDLTLPHFRGIMIFANNFCPTKCAPDRGRCLYLYFFLIKFIYFFWKNITVRRYGTVGTVVVINIGYMSRVYFKYILLSTIIVS